MAREASVPRRTVQRLLFWLLTAIAVSAAIVLGALIIEGVAFILTLGRLLSASAAAGTAILGYLAYRLSRAAHRRRYRITLRGLFAAITLLSVLLAVVGRRGIDAWRHYSSYRAIITTGGAMYDEDEEVGGMGGPFARKSGWVASYLGYDPAARFVRVDLTTDQALQSMAASTDCYLDVEHVILLGPGITDVGLANAHGLAELPHLRHVTFIGATISNDGLRSACEWSQVEGLCINSCAWLTDKGLAHLQQMTQLKKLMLVQEGGMLNLSAVGLPCLRGVPQLETLYLAGIPITDDDLGLIMNLDNLKSIYLLRTQVSEAGARGLKAALPDCKVTWQSTSGSCMQIAPATGATSGLALPQESQAFVQ